ncbi:MAG: DUF1592 domain-containing protein [Planctomycetota bacterium]|nr:DUF1592 domain-containing protein [Planctomycetota bacterium]
MNRFLGVHFIFLLATYFASSLDTAVSAEKREDVFLKTYCVKCHNTEEHKGAIRLDQLALPVTGDNHELWKKVVHNIQRGDMPPENAKHPKAEQRRAFLAEAIRLFTRYEEDTTEVRDPLVRLTNNQIAHSLQDLLQTHEHIADQLIGDPVDKHGFSRQTELDLSGSYLQLYTNALEQVVERAMPNIEPARPDVFRIVGNDWEKCHWAGDNYLYVGHRRLYEGPKWIGDDFEIPLPPRHEYRMFLRENRSKGRFRIRLTLRNEPPENGQPRTPQEIGVYIDQSGRHPYKLVDPITVPVKKGPQEFELFGTLEDHLGVVSDPILAEDRSPGYWLKFRTLSIVNHNRLEGFPLPARFMWTEQIYLVRPDEQWIKAFGHTPGLIPSANGNNGTHGNEAKGPAVYPEAMKTHGYVVIEKVEFETPFFETWPPPAVQPFLSEGKLDRKEMPARLKSFTAKAWRRPLSKADAIHVERIWAEEITAGSSELEALRSSIVTILSDPRFLYLRQSNNYDLTSRLSYFLWDGPPDATLTELAGAHRQLDDSIIDQQVDRLLADKRARQFMETFVAQWVDFTRVDQIAIDPNYYPAFKERGLRIKEYMKQECVEFFAHVLSKDLSCLSLLESDFVLVNETLAEHYGITDVFTPRFVPVAAPEHRGGGALAQAAIMLAQSDGQDAHAVNRGVWIRTRLLGDPPSDPPSDVPSLAESSDDAKASVPVSVKQRLDLHLKAGTTCYDCHKDIDPWGIATEGFDAVGLPRTTIQKVGPVVKKVVIDDHEIDGLLSLKQFLLKQGHGQFAYGFTRHMLSYALGRPLTFRDEPIVRALQSEFEESGHNMRSLIKSIVTSTVYRQGSQSRTHK